MNSTNTFATFDASKVVVKEPITMKNGAQVIYLGYQGAQRCEVKTPKLRTPFGANCYNLETLLQTTRNLVKFNLSVSLSKDNEEHTKFAEQVKLLEARLQEEVPKMKGMKKMKTLSHVLKQDDEEKYDPVLKTKLVKDFQNPEKFKTAFYDSNRQKLFPTLDTVTTVVPKGSEVQLLLSFASVWTMPATGQFGLTLQVSQVLVSPPRQELECVFEADNENKEEVALLEGGLKKLVVTAVATDNDSDNEEFGDPNEHI